MSASTVPNDLTVKLIVAVAENGVIGADGEMPWHYPEDLKHFKETTMGHPVIVGRRTFETIEHQLDGPLPGRTNIVLSRQHPDLPTNAIHAGSLSEAFAIAAEHDDMAFVIGGAAVYEATLPLADAVIVTEIHKTYAGDTYFPEWPLGEEWTEVARDTREELTFYEYERQ
ncbi:MAG: dihydrofolate reductase [Salinarchaeum sp.]